MRACESANTEELDPSPNLSMSRSHEQEDTAFGLPPEPSQHMKDTACVPSTAMVPPQNSGDRSCLEPDHDVRVCLAQHDTSPLAVPEKCRIAFSGI